ncbi:hypothetical protein LZ32DRAFT_54176 [Colletotrichum eremochloae]|nr:hypothetical protein LZ32DRAFT_54176 [Colletotrichum eremochloae]
MAGRLVGTSWIHGSRLLGGLLEISLVMAGSRYTEDRSVACFSEPREWASRFSLANLTAAGRRFRGASDYVWVSSVGLRQDFI